MLACTETVTIIHHEKNIGSDSYSCTVVFGASWFKKTTISTSGDGAKPSNSYECRIMGADVLPASMGDYIALGEVESIETPSDLKEIDHFRITAIGDNRRGKLPHMRYSGQ